MSTLQIRKTSLANVVLGLGAALLLGTVLSQGTQSPVTRAEEPKDSKLKALLKERLATVQEIAKLTKAAYERGGASLEQVHETLHAVLRAELDACDSDKERLAVLERTATHAKDWERQLEQSYGAGQAPPSVLLRAKVFRLEAEIALERARNK